MKRYFLKVFGCQMNESDSQRIASFLEQHEYKSTDKMENADLIVIVACSVRQSAIDRIFGLAPKIRKLEIRNPKSETILTGCVIKSDKPKFEKFFDAVLDINDFFAYHLFSDRTKDGIDYLELKAKHSNSKSAFLPIMTGCNNFCSYCVVPYTRGREISRPIKKIIKEFKNLIKKEYEEIILLGQNVNSYKPSFVKLLKTLNKIPGKFTIKFLTSHPKDMSDELIDVIAESPKISKEIHLPVQSGDNEILRKMNRGYTIEQYLNLIRKIKSKIPEVKITTDVIVGFPEETKKQFENTIKLFKKVKFDMAYINKYSVRSGTAAANFKDNVPLSEKKRRWKILEKLVNKRAKLIVILGPTANGKSELAVELALRPCSGQAEIISADSRQIYKGMNIGTGKVPRDRNFRRFDLPKLTQYKEVEPPYIYKGVVHHLLDIASPNKQFSVAEYKKLAEKAINKIIEKRKIPILCGGTGFYIRAIVDNIIIPEVKPNWKLRAKLEKKSTKELFKQLKKLDPNRAKNIDAKNKRRLIRAIEIVLKTNEPIPQLKINPQYDVLYLGIKKSLPELKKSINKRVDKMIELGLEKEVKNLVKKYGWTMVLKNTIGYKEWQGKNPIENIKTNTYQFAKKQMTWFNKYPGKKINWVKTPAQAEKLVGKFLS